MHTVGFFSISIPIPIQNFDTDTFSIQYRDTSYTTLHIKLVLFQTKCSFMGSIPNLGFPGVLQIVNIRTTFPNATAAEAIFLRLSLAPSVAGRKKHASRSV